MDMGNESKKSIVWKANQMPKELLLSKATVEILMCKLKYSVTAYQVL